MALQIIEYGDLPQPWIRKWQACCIAYQRVLGRTYPKAIWERWAFEDIRKQYLRFMSNVKSAQLPEHEA